MSEPIIYSAVVPDEPPIGTVVLDQAEGQVWQRHATPFAEGSAWVRPQRPGELLGPALDPLHSATTCWRFLTAGRTLIELWRPSEESGEGV